MITSADFSELLAEERIEPRGPQRDDLRVALNTAVLANCHRSKNRSPFTAQHFMPFARKAGFNPRNLAEKLRAMAKARNQ